MLDEVHLKPGKPTYINKSESHRIWSEGLPLSIVAFSGFIVAQVYPLIPTVSIFGVNFKAGLPP